MTRKTLMPEVLPAPTQASVIPPSPVRERVKRHLKSVLIGAAGLTLANCTCLAVDPVPPPARCRTTGNVLDSLMGSVLEFTTDGGEAALQLALKSDGFEFQQGVVVEELLGVTGGQLLDFRPETNGWAEVAFIPSPTATEVTVVFKASCGGPAQTITATLTRGDGGTWSVVFQ